MRNKSFVSLTTHDLTGITHHAVTNIQYNILLTKTTAAQNEAALSYH